MEVLKTSQEIVHEGWLIKSPPTKLWRAVGIHRFVASSYLATYAGPARPGHCLRLSWIQSSRSLPSRRIDSGLGSVLARL